MSFWRTVRVSTMVLLVAGIGRADTPPNAWDIARDPAVRERYQLHVAARQALMLPRGAPLNFRESSREGARAMLEAAGAATSPDVRLRFDLGEIYQQMNRHEKAVELLRPAIESSPDHPGTTDASLALAYAYARLDRPREERDAYLMFLARSTDERARTTALLNLAEAEMRLGNLSDAVVGYRDAVEAASALPNGIDGSKTAVLAVWGLAVALDRSGDPAGAAEQAKFATQLDPKEAIIGDTTDVFFVPEYERQWYFGLGAAARARNAKDPRVAVRGWAQAEARWSTYLAEAERATSDRWVALARAHRDRARIEKAAAQRRAGKAPPLPVDPEEPIIIQ